MGLAPKLSIPPKPAFLDTNRPYLIAGNQEGTANQNRVSVSNSSACADDVNLQATVVGIEIRTHQLRPQAAAYAGKSVGEGNANTSHTAAPCQSVASSADDDGLILPRLPGRLHGSAAWRALAALPPRPLLAKSYATVQSSCLRSPVSGSLNKRSTDTQGQLWVQARSKHTPSPILIGGTGSSWPGKIAVEFYPKASWGGYTRTRHAQASRTVTRCGSWQFALPNGQSAPSTCEGERLTGSDHRRRAMFTTREGSEWQGSLKLAGIATLLAQVSTRATPKATQANVSRGIILSCPRPRSPGHGHICNHMSLSATVIVLPQQHFTTVASTTVPAARHAELQLINSLPWRGCGALRLRHDQGSLPPARH